MSKVESLEWQRNHCVSFVVNTSRVSLLLHPVCMEPWCLMEAKILALSWSGITLSYLIRSRTLQKPELGSLYPFVVYPYVVSYLELYPSGKIWKYIPCLKGFHLISGHFIWGCFFLWGSWCHYKGFCWLMVWVSLSTEISRSVHNTDWTQWMYSVRKVDMEGKNDC